MKDRKANIAGQNKKGLMFVISGPSGSGKTTIVAKLARDRDLRKSVVKSVSLTTRPPRSKEKRDGDYFFLSEKEFIQQRQRKKLLEWTRYLGYYYATPKDWVERNLVKGRSVLLSLDLKGASRLKRLYPERTVTIFILPPSLDALRDRIRRRSPEAGAEEIRSRLERAEAEILAAGEYDYNLTNRNLRKTCLRIKNIISREIRYSEKRG